MCWFRRFWELKNFGDRRAAVFGSFENRNCLLLLERRWQEEEAESRPGYQGRRRVKSRCLDWQWNVSRCELKGGNGSLLFDELRGSRTGFFPKIFVSGIRARS
jgi:hypothetical protein